MSEKKPPLSVLNRRYLIFPRIQFKYAFVSALLMMVAMGCMMVLQSYFFNSALKPGVQRVDLERLQSMVLVLSFFLLFVAGFLSFVVSILVTHRFLGPTFAIRRSLDAIRAGESSVEIKIREHDELRHLVQLLNEVIPSLVQDRGEMKLPQTSVVENSTEKS